MNHEDLNTSTGRAMTRTTRKASPTLIPRALHTPRIIENVAREWMAARNFKVGDVYASDAVLAAARICGYPKATVSDPIIADVIKRIGDA